MNFFKFIKQIDTTKLSLKEMMVTIAMCCLVAVVTYHTWSFTTLTIVWLVSLTSWAYLHIKKSKHTWQRFDDIDERDIEFRDEFEVRIEVLEKQVIDLNKKIERLSQDK